MMKFELEDLRDWSMSEIVKSKVRYAFHTILFLSS